MSAILTLHALQRGRERLGLHSAALLRTAEIALRDGLCHADTTGHLRRYMDGLFLHDRTADNVPIHGEQVFVFSGEKLITVHAVPHSLRAQLAKIRRRREAR